MRTIPSWIYFMVSASLIMAGVIIKSKKKAPRVQLSNNKLNSRMLLCTRIHYGTNNKLPDIREILDFLKSTINATSIIICIEYRVDPDHRAFLEALSSQIRQTEGMHSHVSIESISPWGAFTPALNAAVRRAVDNGFDTIAFQSLETRIPDSIVKDLSTVLQSDPLNLVIGPMFPGHEFHPGSIGLRGRTSPWNTFAIWKVSRLALTGFPLIGDGLGPDVPAGIEEVTTISLLQHIDPRLKALLVRCRGIEWDSSFSDAARQQYHEKKMRSKDERAAAQLSALAIPAGKRLKEFMGDTVICQQVKKILATNPKIHSYKIQTVAANDYWQVLEELISTKSAIMMKRLKIP
eukprot:gene8880-18382_t